jgi:hypothetical protein
MNFCDAISDNMIAYRQMYQSMKAKFEGCDLKHIGRASNEEADTLANIGSTCSAISDGAFYEVINQRSSKIKTSGPPGESIIESEIVPLGAAKNIITEPEQQVLLLEPLWTKNLLAYLLRQELPDDPVEARRTIRRSKSFTIVAR